MKAVGYTQSLPASNPASLMDITLPDPTPGPRDVLVRVEAVSVNPVDTKIRMRAAPGAGEPPKVLGYDAAGVVEAVGSAVSLFKPGDAVWYAGDMTRPGTNSQLHLVDERLVGPKPASLDFAQAAALPLTGLTAWELMVDGMGIPEAGGDGQTLLILGGAGGVGSIMIQLAKALTGLTVVASASRSETQAWVRRMGADHGVDHRQPLGPQMDALGLKPRYAALLTASHQHYAPVVEMLEPFGALGLIDDPTEPLDIMLMKRKALKLVWEFMFARALFQTPDMIRQHDILTRLAALVDAGTVQSTATSVAGPICAQTLRAAHLAQESGSVIGKQVLAGWA